MRVAIVGSFALLLGGLGGLAACAAEDGAQCAVGGEGCECTTGGACDPGLECHSQLCVDVDGSGGDGDGDGDGGGDGDGDGDGGGDGDGDGDGGGDGDGDGDGGGDGDGDGDGGGDGDGDGDGGGDGDGDGDGGGDGDGDGDGDGNPGACPNGVSYTITEGAHASDHALGMTPEHVQIGEPRDYNIAGTAQHYHMVDYTAQDFTDIANAEIVVHQSSETGIPPHSHPVTVWCE